MMKLSSSNRAAVAGMPQSSLVRTMSSDLTLEWDGGKDHPYAEVWVRVDQNDETFIVEQGRGSRNATVELGKNYEFRSDSRVGRREGPSVCRSMGEGGSE